MPNWCENIVTITGEKAILDELESNRFSFGKIIPEPDYNKVVVYPTFPEISGKNPVNINKAWWDWRVQNWGVKWDISGENSDDEVILRRIDDENLEISFLTAWAPPIKIYEELLSIGLEVVAFYFEPNMFFAGSFINGDDTYCNINENLDFFKNEPLGIQMDNKFGILDLINEMSDDFEPELDDVA